MDLSHWHCQLLRNLEGRRRRTQQRHQTSTWIIRVLGIWGVLKIIVVRRIRRLHLGLERRGGIRHRPLRVHVSKVLMRRRRRVGVRGVDRVVMVRRRLRGIGVGPTSGAGGRRIRGRRGRERGGHQIRVSITIANVIGEVLGIRVGSGDGGGRLLLRRRRGGLEQFVHIEGTSAWCVGIARGSHLCMYINIRINLFINQPSKKAISASLLLQPESERGRSERFSGRLRAAVIYIYHVRID